MNPQEALQYLSQVGSDFSRSLPPSSQGPTVLAINQALAVLEPLARAAMEPPSPLPSESLAENVRPLT